MTLENLYKPAIALILCLPVAAVCAQSTQAGGQYGGQYGNQGNGQYGGQNGQYGGQNGQYGGQNGQYGQGDSGRGGWDAPPSEFSDDLQRHAFHDGIEAARADFSNHVQPSPEGHEEFRHPQVPYPSRDTYREAYKRGYFLAVRHMQEHLQDQRGEAPVPQPGYRPQPGGWDAPPSEYADDLQRRAFHDGIEAARADVTNQAQPSPESHEEFRHPKVPFLARETYREAYKRGYFMAVRHMQEQGR